MYVLGFGLSLAFLHHFVSAKLANSSIRVNMAAEQTIKLSRLKLLKVNQIAVLYVLHGSQIVPSCWLGNKIKCSHDRVRAIQDKALSGN